MVGFTAAQSRDGHTSDLGALAKVRPSLGRCDPILAHREDSDILVSNMNSESQVVHLDQKDFINLAKAQHACGDGNQFVAALRTAKQRVLSGSAFFPLSSSHYVETSKNHNPTQRRDLALLMGGLSLFRTMAPPQPIIEAEVEHALHRLMGKPERPKPIEVFGVGMAHAVGLPFSPEDMWRQNGYDPDAYDPLAVEHFLLEAPEGPTAYDEERREKATAYAKAEERRAAALAQSPPPQAMRPKLFDLVGLWDFRGVFIAAQIDAGLPGDFISEELSEEELYKFLRDIPTLHVLAELRRLGHENPQKPWEPNDMRDLRSLAVALVYCDVVFCDKRWWHEIRRSGLAARHGTRVCRRTEELEEL